MPRQRGDGAANGLLQMLGYPPVVFFLEIANGNDSGSRSDCEFLFRRRPSNEGSCTIDPKKHKCWLPPTGRLFPDVCVAVLDIEELSSLHLALKTTIEILTL